MFTRFELIERNTNFKLISNCSYKTSTMIRRNRQINRSGNILYNPCNQTQEISWMEDIMEEALIGTCGTD